MDLHEIGEWLKYAFPVIIAAIGGGLGFVMRENDKGNRIVFWRVMLNMASSGFVGLLVSLLCEAMKMDQLWTGFAAGVFGWLGANVSIRLLERVAYERLGISLRTNTAQRVEAAKAQEEERP
ncbi:phage holin family protein [Novosphingobium guangzhouense]|uniref:Holin n=1 Tax=Novosphingobium guangzhouense TaxID=1850347 RepID=A0A2K2FUR7_9SPHN|nr:phage holin family protein [Novosphingobium guangzhouense]PNU02531.1 hypothetical protein A8V01_09130 [Novosphingobium guangzhouense]